MTPRSRARRFSTTACVAMPAWSVPGSHIVGRPHMRCHRASESSTAAVSAWPRCRLPVTFGGGMTMTKRPSGPAASAAAGSHLKKPAASHHAPHAASTAAGWYAGSISVVVSAGRDAGRGRGEGSAGWGEAARGDTPGCNGGGGVSGAGAAAETGAESSNVPRRHAPFFSPAGVVLT